MTPERWRQVTEVFHAALTRTGSARAPYLDQVCAGDPTLRAEVEAMLAVDPAAGLDAIGVDLSVTSTPHLESGTMIGFYRIEGLIGTGAMGHVYRALDTKLGRDVAVKVLPPISTSDPDRLARFQREARVLAALNHPNIATIHGIEDADEIHALVLELIEGETLADRIAHAGGPQGPPPRLDDALHIARQIAEALEAAHEKDIIHRDLKPANIAITPNGIVKVLDFGLAKIYASESPAADPRQAQTITVATREGMILGTAAYMSPEQARGQAVDQRTDIWAFGCVLYEMLTGRRPFSGETLTDTLAAILDRDPDWTALPETTPRSVQHLLQRCLQKDSRRRLHDIADARIELEDVAAANAVKREAPVGAHPAARPKRREGVAWAIAVLALVTAGVLYLRRPPVDTHVYRSALLPPAGVSLPPVGVTPSARFSISPDGLRIAFVGTEGGGVTRLWVQSLDGRSTQPLAGTEGGVVPFWSPDSRFIGFLVDGSVKTIAATGGPPVTLTAGTNASSGGATWNQDGLILFAATGTGNPLYRVAASGGVPTPATTLHAEDGETRHAFPFFLPDGRHFLYLAVGSKTAGLNSPNGIYVTALDSNERKLLVPGGSNAMYAQGYLLFLRAQTLMAQPFDAERLELIGDAVPIAEGVAIGGQQGAAGAFTVSQSGILAYQTGPAGIASGDPTGLGVSTRLIWLDRSGKQIGVLGEPARFGNLQLAPDGKRLAVSVGDLAERSSNIWLFDVARGLRTRFTFDPSDELSSVWSPDGSRIVFNASRKGVPIYGLYQKASSGAGDEEELLTDSPSLKQLVDWSQDGRFVLFMVGFPKPLNSLWVLPLFGDRKPFPFRETQFDETFGRFSPDGRWIAYSSNESGRNEVYVTRFPGPRGKSQVSAAGGTQPRWRRDGKEIFYLDPDNRMVSAAVNGAGSAFEVGAVRSLFATRAGGPGSVYDVSPDGQRFLVNTLVEEAAPAPITLVVNWPALVKK